ncbi:hypothetical protein [Alkalilimnicola sp. S0819]|uniref:hypothetical protein n=1 Tax=Alkalilimnicola sp. S0819 TaxID=2613922 RepID=UPI0012624068|nr:hypothetical protein [Alkalilimnicola sp. S0819]KAB7627343.1 hypothetical protein F3N43_05370 [Alkalilimnicola sp. S0819]MPQ16060.1 hypothetical protein [Alkalilimnicola sp. S0819]
MTAEHAAHEPDEPEAAAQDEGLGDNLAEALASARGLVDDYLALAALEARLAGHSLVGILVLAICLAFVLMAAWLGLQIAAAFAMARLGWPLDLGLVGVTLANLLLGALCLRGIRGRARQLGFQGLRQALRGEGNAARTETSHR